MSLDVLKIPPAMANRWEPYLDPEIKAMVFATMNIGWGEITEKNHVEWFSRLRIWELAAGPSRWVCDTHTGEMVDRYFTLDDVKRYIGLETNVFNKEPDYQFAESIRNILLRRVQGELRAQGYDLPRSTGDTYVIRVTPVEPDAEDDDTENGGETRFRIKFYDPYGRLCDEREDVDLRDAFRYAREYIEEV